MTIYKKILIIKENVWLETEIKKIKPHRTVCLQGKQKHLKLMKPTLKNIYETIEDGCRNIQSK